MGQAGQIELFKIHIATPVRLLPGGFQIITAAAHCEYRSFHQEIESYFRERAEVFARRAPNRGKNILSILLSENLADSLSRPGSGRSMIPGSVRPARAARLFAKPLTGL